MINEQAPECCPFCGAGEKLHLPHTAFRWFKCGTITVPADNNRRDQTPACATAERERLTRERDEARRQQRLGWERAAENFREYEKAKDEAHAALARVKQLESEWSGWPDLQREWFGDKYAAMQPWDAVRARIEDTEARVKRLEEAGDAMERRLKRFSSGGLDTSGRADRQPASIEGLVVADFRLVDQAIQQWKEAKEATP